MAEKNMRAIGRTTCHRNPLEYSESQNDKPSAHDHMSRAYGRDSSRPYGKENWHVNWQRVGRDVTRDLVRVF